MDVGSYPVAIFHRQGFGLSLHRARYAANIRLLGFGGDAPVRLMINQRIARCLDSDSCKHSKSAQHRFSSCLFPSDLFILTSALRCGLGTGSRSVKPYRTALEARHLMVTESGYGGGEQALGCFPTGQVGCSCRQRLKNVRFCVSLVTQERTRKTCGKCCDGYCL